MPIANVGRAPEGPSETPSQEVPQPGQEVPQETGPIVPEKVAPEPPKVSKPGEVEPDNQQKIETKIEQTLQASRGPISSALKMETASQDKSVAQDDPTKQLEKIIEEDIGDDANLAAKEVERITHLQT